MSWKLEPSWSSSAGEHEVKGLCVQCDRQSRHVSRADEGKEQQSKTEQAAQKGSLVLISDCQPVHFWTISKCNLAEGPSRKFEPK